MSLPAGMAALLMVKPGGRFSASSSIFPSNPSERMARTEKAAVPPGAICRPDGSMHSLKPGLEGVMRRR